MAAVTPMTMPVERAEHNLQGLLEQLQMGEAMTLVNSEGTPVAVLVSLKPMPATGATPASDWEAQWEGLAEQVSRAWKSEKSAAEVVSEMRR